MMEADTRDRLMIIAATGVRIRVFTGQLHISMATMDRRVHIISTASGHLMPMEAGCTWIKWLLFLSSSKAARACRGIPMKSMRWRITDNV